MKNWKKSLVLLTMVFMLSTLCGALAADGVFYGQNDHGVGGTIKVAVTMEGDTIKAIKTLEQKETRGLGTTAIMQLTKDIVAANSTDVDIVSGATLSSLAFTGAVRQAEEEAMEFDIDEIADDLIRDLMANCLFTPRLTRDAVFVLCEWYNSINQIIICNNY